MIEYSNSQIRLLIDEYIHSERDRALLKRRLIDGICFEPLAEEFDISVRHCVPAPVRIVPKNCTYEDKRCPLASSPAGFFFYTLFSERRCGNG